MSINTNGAGAAYGTSARATQAERAVIVLANLYQSVKYRPVIFDWNGEFLPIWFGVSGFGVKSLNV